MVPGGTAVALNQRRVTRFAVLCVLSFAMSGCTADPEDRPATWSYIHAAVILPNCATSSCHSALATTAGVVLDDPDVAYHSLIDGNYVVPGDPSSSLMFLLEGDERPRMPPDAPLPAGDVRLIEAWITAGAAK
jgi:hypothetical protein